MSRTYLFETPTPAGNLVVDRGGSQGLRITDDQWTINIGGSTPTGGSFVLNVPNGQSVTVSWNETAQTLQTKLAVALGAGQAICTGTGLPSGNILIVFTGTLAQASQTCSIGTNSLTGGGTPAAVHSVTGNATTETAPTGSTTLTSLALKMGDLPLQTYTNMTPQQAYASYRSTFGLGAGSVVPIELFA